MYCDYCTHVRYSRDGGSTYCGRTGKYKYICHFNPALETCPECGGKVRLGYACGEYFIVPKAEGCDYCNGFNEMHSSKEIATIAWDNKVERIKGIKAKMDGDPHDSC